MKKLIFLFLVVFLFSAVSYPDAASAISTWAKTYGGGLSDGTYSMQPTADGGYIVGGWTNSFGAGNNDVWISKLDSEGEIEWQKAYGGTSADVAFSIQQTADGGYIVGGQTNSFGAINSDAWILKLDPKGNVEWQKTYGATGQKSFPTHFNEPVYSIQQTPDKGYIAVGISDFFKKYATELNDMWILKIDSLGNIQWQKTLDGLQGGAEIAYSVQITSDGGFVVAGVTTSDWPPYSCAWILKFDADGNIQWQKAYGSTVRYSGFSARDIQQTDDNGYIVAGYTTSSGAGSYDFFVFKLDSNGNIQWQKTYGGSSYDVPSSIQQTSDGGYIVGGGTSSFGAGHSDVWVLKLDSEGEIEWQKAYGSSAYEEANSIQQTSDGGYIFAGLASAGYNDVFILKLDDKGNVADPDCAAELVRDTNVTAVNSNATVVGTVLTIQIPSILSQDSAAVVTDTNVTPMVLCMQSNQPPTANAGADQTVSCGGADGASVTLDGSGSSDPDGDELTYSWTGVFGTASGVSPSVLIPPGTHTITLTVNDGKGEEASDTVDITVKDVTAPSTTATVTGTSGNNGWYKSDVSAALVSTDDCSGVKEIHYTLDGIETVIAGSSASLTITTDGTHTLTYYAIDNAGNAEAAHSLAINIDKTLPVVNISVNPGMLWPPNHAIVDVVINGAASDGSGIASVKLIVADEYGEYNMTIPDFALGSAIQLEAWREGTDIDGRVYTITVIATDMAGNETTTVLEAIVPHDMGK